MSDTFQFVEVLKVAVVDDETISCGEKIVSTASSETVLSGKPAWEVDTVAAIDS
jgi:hypothetical protein